MKKKILFTIILGILFFTNIVSSIGFISSSLNLDNCQSIGEFAVNSTVELYQTCPSCFGVNITYIKSPESTLILNENMNKSGSTFTYNFSDTYQFGDYFYVTEGDKDGVVRTECFSFIISKTGQQSNGGMDYIPSIIIFLIAIILLTLGILFNNEIAKGTLYVLSIVFTYVTFQLTLIIVKSSNFIQRSGASDYLDVVFKSITWIIGGIFTIAIVIIAIWVFKKINIKKGFMDEIDPLGV